MSSYLVGEDVAKLKIIYVMYDFWNLIKTVPYRVKQASGLFNVNLRDRPCISPFLPINLSLKPDLCVC